MQLLLGTLMGIAIPIIISLISVKTKYGGIPEDLIKSYPAAFYAPFLQLGAIGNLVVFFILGKLDKEMMQRGIIAGTILIFVLVLLLKFIL